MSRRARSEFASDVLRKDDFLDFVLRAHLHMERWLDELLAKHAAELGKTYDREKRRFSAKITACESAKLISPDLAVVVRKVNDLRNNYAHVRRYRPSRTEIARLQRAFREMEQPFYVPLVAPSQRNMCMALAALSGHLQRLAGVLEVA